VLTVYAATRWCVPPLVLCRHALACRARLPARPPGMMREEVGHCIHRLRRNKLVGASAPGIVCRHALGVRPALATRQRSAFYPFRTPSPPHRLPPRTGDARSWL
jgi:hypothetical protein